MVEVGQVRATEQPFVMITVLVREATGWRVRWTGGAQDGATTVETTDWLEGHTMLLGTAGDKP